MEATTTTPRLPAPLRVAWRLQFQLLGRSRRVILLGLALLVILGLAELVSRHTAAIPRPSQPALLMLFGWLWAVGAAWALTIWRDESPAKRSYHAAMPVDRVAHDLTRVLAGAVWLLAAVAAAIAIGFALAAPRGQVADLLGVGAHAWLNFFTAPLQTYLAVSIATTLLNRPVEWILGGLVTMVGIMLAAVYLRLFAVVETVAAFFGRPWGFAGAIADGFNAGTGRAVGGTSITIHREGVQQTEIVREYADPMIWLAAVAIWLVGLSLALWLAASRRRLG